MSKYECPNCDGGFPEPLDKECPWCGQDMNKSYTDGPEIGVGVTDPVLKRDGATEQRIGPNDLNVREEL